MGGAADMVLPEVEASPENMEVEVVLLKVLVILCLEFSDSAAGFLVSRIRGFVLEYYYIYIYMVIPQYKLNRPQCD